MIFAKQKLKDQRINNTKKWEYNKKNTVQLLFHPEVVLETWHNPILTLKRI